MSVRKSNKKKRNIILSFFGLPTNTKKTKNNRFSFIPKEKPRVINITLKTPIERFFEWY